MHFFAKKESRLRPLSIAVLEVLAKLALVCNQAGDANSGRRESQDELTLSHDLAGRDFQARRLAEHVEEPFDSLVNLVGL